MSPPDFEPALADALDDLAISGRVLVAVSGGADSVALLRALVDMDDLRPLEIVAAHLDHQLRGKASTEDAAWVRRLCWSLKVPLSEHRLAKPNRADQPESAVEESARNARYEFLTASAVEHRCAWVLVAHTADDQVETVLHHILRGTGIDGLRGIPPTRSLAAGITLARPLLGFKRADIEAYLRWSNQDWRDDATNRDTRLTRNRIRHKLLPDLREHHNPQIDAALLRLAQQAAELQSVVDPLVDKLAADACLAADPDVIRIDTALLIDSPLHLIREVIRRIWRDQQWPLGGMSYHHWTTAAQVALGKLTAIDLPGNIHAARRGSLLVLTRKNAPPRLESDSAPG